MLSRNSVRKSANPTKYLDFEQAQGTLARGIGILADISALAEALNVNASLTKLDLPNNRVKDALKANASLTDVCLMENKLEDTPALAEGLKVNTNLTKLDICWNSIEDISALTEALKTNASLKKTVPL